MNHLELTLVCLQQKGLGQVEGHAVGVEADAEGVQRARLGYDPVRGHRGQHRVVHGASVWLGIPSSRVRDHAQEQPTPQVLTAREREEGQPDGGETDSPSSGS